MKNINFRLLIKMVIVLTFFLGITCFAASKSKKELEEEYRYEEIGMGVLSDNEAFELGKSNQKKYNENTLDSENVFENELEIRKKVVNRKVVYEKAIYEGYNINEEHIDEVINEIRALVENTRKEELQAYLLGAEITEDEYWEYVRPIYKEKLLVKKYIQEEIVKKYIEEVGCMLDKNGGIYNCDKILSIEEIENLNEEIERRINSEIEKILREHDKTERKKYN